jgi:asparagine synthase (glutamine-hydrolysing)
MLKQAFGNMLPAEITGRRDKMGFPVPLAAWFHTELRELVGDLFGSAGAGELPYLNRTAVRRAFEDGQPFSRKSWGLLSLEIWRRQMQDEARHRFIR